MSRAQLSAKPVGGRVTNIMRHSLKYLVRVAAVRSSADDDWRTLQATKEKLVAQAYRSRAGSL
jgi:hypothetical protein